MTKCPACFSWGANLGNVLFKTNFCKILRVVPLPEKDSKRESFASSLHLGDRKNYFLNCLFSKDRTS